MDGETGFLVPVEQQDVAPFEAVDPDKFARDLAAAINTVLDDDALRASMAEKGQARTRDVFFFGADQLHGDFLVRRVQRDQEAVEDVPRVVVADREERLFSGRHRFDYSARIFARLITGPQRFRSWRISAAVP